MRETSKGEHAHLPAGTYQEWLKSEVARPGSVTRHKVPVDIYEIWLKGKVKERLLQGRSRTSKTRKRAAAFHAK